MEDKIIEEIFDQIQKDGFVPGTEQYDICSRSLKFRNYSYKRDEELVDVNTVDCSTLVSQSYWEGAAIGIPFIAEGQRTALSAQIIVSFDDLRPADVVIKYPSLDASPDKTWNHVGLYLGRAASGVQWIIESASKTGVKLSKLQEFDPQGGLRRYTLTSDVFSSTHSASALRLTNLVPKFGRLGVRQYSKSGGERVAHTGVDLYTPENTNIYATTNGRIVITKNEVEESNGVEIHGDNIIVRYLMLKDINVKEGSFVKIGDLLGRVSLPSVKSNIEYSSAKKSPAHLHLEVENLMVEKTTIANQLTVNGRQYFNHLYLSKAGKLGLPFNLSVEGS